MNHMVAANEGQGVVELYYRVMKRLHQVVVSDRAYRATEVDQGQKRIRNSGDAKRLSKVFAGRIGSSFCDWEIAVAHARIIHE